MYGYDCILKNFHRVTCCVDDTCSWDKEFGDPFWHVLDFQLLTVSNKIKQNPNKFQSRRTEIEFIGFC